MNQEIPKRPIQDQTGPAQTATGATTQPHRSIPRPLQQKRRKRVIRRLILTALLALAMVMLFLVGREWFNRRDYLRGMRGFSEQIMAFHDQDHRWPSPEKVAQFKSKARIKAAHIKYEPSLVPKNAPAETLLAYLPLLNMTFLPKGHAAMDVTGRVCWLTDDELESRLAQRQRLYNAQLMQNSQ